MGIPTNKEIGGDEDEEEHTLGEWGTTSE